MTRARPRLLLAPLVLAASLALAGCGADAGSDDPAGGATASSTAAPSDTSTTEPTDSPSESPTDDPTDSPTDDSTASGADGVPTSYDAAVGLLDAAPGPARRVNRFQTPGGGVFCILVSDFLPTSCELAQGQAVPAPEVCGADGPSDAVGRIEVTDGTVQPVCNSDTIREGRARDLAVGETTSIKDLPVRCLSRADGMVCVDDDARTGFFLGDGRYEVF